jgi:hypothetical protein
MGAVVRHTDTPFGRSGWQADVLQAMETGHLVAWSQTPRTSVQFASGLAQFLRELRETEVLSLYGRYITDLESFCHQLERLLPGPRLERRIDGPRGVTAMLRRRQDYPGRSASRFRYYIWHDADTLLRADARLFGHLVDALAGVAAEAEFVSDELLLLHRVVLAGGPVLGAYAEDPRGQLCRWLDDGLGEPFWQIVTGLDRPCFRRLELDALPRPVAKTVSS